MVMPKVSVIKNTLGQTGGLEKWMDRLSLAFAAKGCPVTIISTDTPHFDSPLITSKRLKVLAPLSYQRLAQFDKLATRFVEKHPTDIVFGLDRSSCQTHHRAGNGCHAAYLEKRKLFEPSWKLKSFAVNPLHKQILKMEKATFENPKLRSLFTNSEMVKKEILKYYDVPEEKLVVVHNGVEWKELEKHFALWVEKKSKICRELDLDPATFHFIFIGSGYARKGLDTLLSAMQRLPSYDFHLSVVGRDKNLEKYIQKTHEMGLSEKVSFYGERRDTHNFYQLADSLVIPSYYDPFANVTVEALAMGLHVVSSSYNGGSEILTPETGIVVDHLETVDTLADALIQAMQKPKTWIRSVQTRDSVKHLDFSYQLAKIIDRTISV